MNVSICFEIDHSDYNSNYYDFLKLKEIWKDVTFFPLINVEQLSEIVKTYRKFKSNIFRLKQSIFRLVSHQKSEETDSLRYQSLVNQPYLSCKADFVNHVAEILKKNQFDIIQVEFISLAPLIHVLPKENIRVLVHHELRYIRIKREVDIFENVSAYDLMRLESIKEQEISLLQKFDKIITLTENDKSALSKNILSEKIFVSPATIKENPANPESFNTFVNKLVFIGSSIHLPNKDGIQWFINTIMPILEKGKADIKLEIIGSWDKKFIKKYSRDNVHFTGFINNLTDALKSSLLIVPIRIGSGMRLKIIEAVNHNIPFITTSIGIEGLDFENEKDCLIADTPESFAKGIVRLAMDSSLQQNLVKNASLRLAEKYSYESSIKKRLDFYINLI